MTNEAKENYDDLAARRAKGTAASRASHGARRLKAMRDAAMRAAAFERARDAIALETQAREQERQARLAAQEAAREAREAARARARAEAQAQREAERRARMEAQERAREAARMAQAEEAKAAAAARSTLLAIGDERGGVRVRSDPAWPEPARHQAYAAVYEVEFLVCGHVGRLTYDNIRRRHRRGPGDPTYGCCPRCAQQIAGRQGALATNARLANDGPRTVKRVRPSTTRSVPEPGATGPAPGTPYHALEEAQRIFAEAIRWARGVPPLGRVPAPPPRPAGLRGA